MSQTNLLVRTRTRQTPTDPTPGAGTFMCEEVAIGDIVHANRHIRRRAKKLLDANASCIEAHGVSPPILVDRKTRRILQGEGHFETYRQMKRSTVPVIWVDGLSSAQVDCVQLWLAAFEASGEFDADAIRDKLEMVLESDPDLLSQVFFDMGQIDLFLHTPPEEKTVRGDGAAEEATSITRPGDVFTWPAGH